MTGWFGQGQDYGDGGLMGKLTEEGDGPSWKARLTGIPDSAPTAQGQTLAMALAQAGAAIAQANQPGYGRRNTGDLLAIGVGDFGQGLGMQAMQRQRAAVEQAKAKMAQMQGGEREQADMGRLPGRTQSGAMDPAWYGLSGEADRRYAQQADGMRNEALRKQEMAQRGALSNRGATSPEYLMDQPHGMEFSKRAGKTSPLFIEEKDGGQTPWTPPQDGKTVPFDAADKLGKRFIRPDLSSFMR